MMNDASFLYALNCPSDILAFTTTRNRFYPDGRCESFNLGVFTDDESVKVLKNIEYLKQSFNINRLAFLKQIHGNKVFKINSANFSDIYLSEGDGLFTEDSDLALGIFTADCFPVLMAGKKSVAAIHCGWRSITSGIIENSLKLFSEISDYPFYVYVGPGICADCYEIKDDMIEKLNKAYNPIIALVSKSNGAYLFNLKQYLSNAFKVNGIENIFFSEKTTCSEDMFYSYRLSSGKTGRMLSVIMRLSN